MPCGTDDGLSRRKSRIGAGIPAPNDDVSMPIGSKILTEVVVLVANSMDMTGISVNRIDSILDSENIRAEYGLGAGGSKSLYRMVERLGRNSDSIVRYLGRTRFIFRSDSRREDVLRIYRRKAEYDWDDMVNLRQA